MDKDKFFDDIIKTLREANENLSPYEEGLREMIKKTDELIHKPEQ